MAAAGARLLPLSDAVVEVLLGLWFRRGLFEKSRYPSLPGDVPSVD